jgi:hypothetical protein
MEASRKFKILHKEARDSVLNMFYPFRWEIEGFFLVHSVAKCQEHRDDACGTGLNEACSMHCEQRKIFTQCKNVCEF